jgi:alanine racemase
VRGRIIHAPHHAAGSTLGIGYATPIQLEDDLRIGVVPVGFWDGLNHVPPLGEVLVNGRRARLVGRRSFQHTVIDITDIPEATTVSVVTTMGRDGDEAITINELGKDFRLPVMELIFRLAGSLPHIEIGTQPKTEVAPIIRIVGNPNG